MSLRVPASAAGGRDFRADDVLVFEQAIAIGREQVGQQHQPIALGEQHQQFARAPASTSALLASSATAARLRGAGTAGFSSTFSSARMLREEIDESGELSSSISKIGLLLARRRRSRARA